MKRRRFIRGLCLTGTGLILWPLILVSGENCINSCQQCPTDFECCKTFIKPLYGQEKEILEWLGRKHDKKLTIVFDRRRGQWMWMDRLCPFFNKAKSAGFNCDVYELRPFCCRIYHCSAFCLAPADQAKIEDFHRKEWDFGNKVKL